MQFFSLPISIIATYISFFIITYAAVFLIILYLFNREKMEIKGKKWSKLPFVSILLPVYNEEKLIKKTINSLLSLDYPKDKYEIIIVDDGSTDKTPEKLKSFGKKIRYIRIKHFGNAAHAKNVGLKYAKGDFIATMDSDSFVEKDVLKKMLSLFNDDYVGAASAAVKIYEPKSFLAKFQYIEYAFILFLRRLLMTADSVYVTPGPFSMFKKEVLEEADGFNEKSITEDQEIAIHLQSLGYRIRSSLDAIVYTVPPLNLTDLIKQRVRWLRGGIRNRIIHKHLYNPKYGDFVYIGMIMDFIFFLPMVLMFVVLADKFIFNNYFWYDKIGFLSSWVFGLDGLSFIALFLIISSFLWTLYGISNIEIYEKKYKNKISLLDIALFSFVYSYIWVAVWLTVIFKELTGAKQVWETR
ncbi:glycosyltransferase family 2 protein [Candidatus Micrarchaeota archaeon]|nr:glycosyltransferase family 2 protein [Candidatus Micrarchaeota archaeon]